MTAYNSPKILSQAGFTLVEMMVALVIAMLGMSAILIAHMGQNQSYTTQLQTAGARQKARATIAMLRADLLMANQFIAAGPATITFHRIGAPPGINVTYQWMGNGNGAPVLLRRDDGAPPQQPDNVFADGIDGIEFFYQFKNAPPANQVNAAQLGDITSVTISMVSRANGPDPHFQDRDIYRTASRTDWDNETLNNGPLNDNFHRRFWQETVACRNMGQ